MPVSPGGGADGERRRAGDAVVGAFGAGGTDKEDAAPGVRVGTLWDIDAMAAQARESALRAALG